MRNTVAKTIKMYAIINAIAGIILAIKASSSELFTLYGSTFYGQGISVFVLIASTGIVVSFGIYALGEIIDLLQGIKDNIEKSKNDEKDESNSVLPSL